MRLQGTKIIGVILSAMRRRRSRSTGKGVLSKSDIPDMLKFLMSSGADPGFV